MKLVIDIQDDVYRVLKEDIYPIPDTERLALVFKTFVKNGTVLPKENGFIAICKPNKPLPEDIKKSLKETLFIADEDCLYNFDMIEIIDTGQEAEHGDE